MILRTSGGVVIGHEALNHAPPRRPERGSKRVGVRARLLDPQRSSDGRCWLHRSSTPGPTGSSAWPMRCRSVLTLSASLSRSLSAPGDPVGLPEGTSRASRSDRAASGYPDSGHPRLAELVQAPKGQCLNGGVSGPLKRDELRTGGHNAYVTERWRAWLWKRTTSMDHEQSGDPRGSPRHGRAGAPHHDRSRHRRGGRRRRSIGGAFTERDLTRRLLDEQNLLDREVRRRSCRHRPRR